MAWITERCVQALDSLLSWSDRERRFLDRLLDEGELDAAALVDEPVLQGRIARQPMLQWKALNVREYRGGR